MSLEKKKEDRAIPCWHKQIAAWNFFFRSEIARDPRKHNRSGPRYDLQNMDLFQLFGDYVTFSSLLASKLSCKW